MKYTAEAAICGSESSACSFTISAYQGFSSTAGNVAVNHLAWHFYNDMNIVLLKTKMTNY